MKNVEDWDLDYILNLPEGEHDWVEFKSSRSLDFTAPGGDQSKALNELSKQISAFANSGGGSIVYGIEDQAAGQPRAVDATGGVPANFRKGTKEWLEDVIPTLVEFPLASFNLYPLIGPGVAAGRAIYVVHVPSSETAPHQANDNRYYARIGGKSRPIGHRFVLDILGRAKSPQMRLEFSIRKKLSGASRKNVDALFAMCRNVGRVYANYVNGFLYVPDGFLKSRRRDSTVTRNGDQYSKIWFDNTHEDTVGYEKGYMGGPDRRLTISRYDPVLPTIGFSALYEELGNELANLAGFEEKLIYWEVFADSSLKAEGSVPIGDIVEAKG